MGCLKTPRPVLGGSGEGAFHVAEQFGFEQRFGDGGAIDFQYRLVMARALLVNHARQQALAGAGFALQKHRRLGQRNLVDHGGEFQHARILGHQARVLVVIQYVLQAALVGDVRHHHQLNRIGFSRHRYGRRLDFQEADRAVALDALFETMLVDERAVRDQRIAVSRAQGGQLQINTGGLMDFAHRAEFREAQQFVGGRIVEQNFAFVVGENDAFVDV